MRVMPDSMSPLRFLLLAIPALLTFTLFLPAFGPLSPSTLRAEEPSLDQQKLDLEVKELRHKLSGWGKVERLAPAIAAFLAFIGAVVGAVLTFRSRNKELRLNTITNLKRELASENLAVRITAVHALADYPKEAVPTLIASLGSTVKREGSSQVEEDTAFTSAVKDSLRQIGKKSVNPLINELRRIQGEIRDILISGKDEKVKRLYQGLPFAIFNEFSKGSEAVRRKLKEVAGWQGID
ncbi:MAG: hypothetical protein Q6354_08315, partial [Candidatus Brocadiales bacterium]|nr:hypothetical protein [Candidatus Brocadiales bacterium]